MRKKDEIDGIESLLVTGFEQGESATIDAILQKVKDSGADLAYIDNFDLIENERGMSEMEHQREASKQLMNFCKNVKTPLIVLHHLKKTKEGQSIDSLRGSGKITDDATSVYICRRYEGDEPSDYEKRKFSVIEKKDREFGELGIANYLFNSGTFDHDNGSDGFNS